MGTIGQTTKELEQSLEFLAVRMDDHARSDMGRSVHFSAHVASISIQGLNT
jgi:hypothetical protein